MKINILHLTDNQRESIAEFSKQNPHGKVNMRTGNVETFSLVHYFRKVKNVEDARMLAGINFNSIMVSGLSPSEDVIKYLWTRIREPSSKEGSLIVSVLNKKEQK